MTRPQGLKLTGSRCQCPTCGDYFGNVVGFDRHRVGVPDIDRRCLTESEMIHAGWTRNGRGFWLRPSPERGPVGLQGDNGAQTDHAGGAP